MSTRSGFRAFVVAVIASGATVAALILLSTPRTALIGPEPTLFAIFSALLVLVETRPVSWLRRREGSQITASLSYACALMFLSAGYGAALVAGVASITGDVLQRRAPIKVAFNAAQMTLSIAAGTAVLHVAGLHSAVVAREPFGPAFLPVFALSCVLIYTVNSVLVHTVVALHEGTPVWHTLRRDFAASASTDGMLLALGPVYVVAAQRSLLLLPLVLLLTFSVYSSTRMALERQHEATHDPLTGLPNRRMFEEQVADVLVRAGRRRQRCAVVILDLDGFKAINDRLGHEVGDALLAAVGERLDGSLQPVDMVARVGGDEFAFLLGDVGDRAATERRVRAIHRALCEPLVVEGFPLSIGGSFGIAVFPEHGRELTELARLADLSMYLAKRDGGGVVYHQPKADTRHDRGRVQLLREVEDALARDEFVVHYQPQVDLASGRVVGVEALLRWHHPEHGTVAPDDFIPHAEHTDLIAAITERVLQRALADCAAWRRAGHDLPVAVNLSAANLRDRNLPRLVAGLLDTTGLPADLLELELTEHAVLDDPVRTTGVLTDLRSLGIDLAIDDFGTGFSSLSQLRDLPVQSIKIDRSFVAGLLVDPHNAAILTMIVQLGGHLGLRTVAEGVESAAVLERLAAIGCDAAQGYLIAPPMPAPELLAWIHDRARLEVRR